MQINKKSEIIISTLFILFLFLCLDPFDWFMYSMWGMLILIFSVLIFGIFAIFVWREGKGDERDAMHRMLAGRYAFLLGSGTLMLGIVIESLQDDLDHWLVITLGVMVLTKVFGISYSQRKF